MCTDVMHSYLGLAALALYETDDANIKSLDPALCISKNAVGNLQRVAWKKKSNSIA